MTKFYVPVHERSSIRAGELRARGKVRARVQHVRALSDKRLMQLAYQEARKNPLVKHAQAEAHRRGLWLAAQEKIHAEWIDFTPATFVLQRHWWGKKDHYDLRISKKTAPSWFGITLYTDPAGSPTQGDKHMGGVKGFEQLMGAHPKRGIKMEGMGEMKWMDFEGAIPVGGSGNPTVNLTAHLKIIDRGQAVIHRREADFTDITFLGSKLKGRHYHRQVEYKDDIRWYFWKAKPEDQFSPDEMKKVALGQLHLKPRPAKKAKTKAKEPTLLSPEARRRADAKSTVQPATTAG